VFFSVENGVFYGLDQKKKSFPGKKPGVKNALLFVLFGLNLAQIVGRLNDW